MGARWDEDQEDAASAQVAADRRALKGLDAVYRRSAELLKGFGCAETAECYRLRDTGREPYLFPIELLRVRRALDAVGRAMPPPREDGACRLLSDDGLRCSIYADRPFGCRTFFCSRVHGPRRFPESELHQLTARLTRVSDERDPGAHPRPLTELLDELSEAERQAAAMTSATSPQSRAKSASPKPEPDRSQPR